MIDPVIEDPDFPDQISSFGMPPWAFVATLSATDEFTHLSQKKGVTLDISCFSTSVIYHKDVIRVKFSSEDWYGEDCLNYSVLLTRNVQDKAWTCQQFGTEENTGCP